MYLLIKNEIENNIFSTTITVDALGTEELSEDEERELLGNFVRNLSYRTLDFKKCVKIEGKVPVVTDGGANIYNIVEVKLPALSNKEIPVNEDFIATYKIDCNKIPQSATDAYVLKTKELVAQAYCVVFADVICKEMERIMDDIREKSGTFEGETIITI